jgi:hypothetical protein
MTEINTDMQDYLKDYLVDEQATESTRVDVARKEAQTNVGKTHPVLGKCIATIPARDYFRLVQAYGTEEVHSKEFLKYFNKEYPDLSPNKA